MEVEMTTKMWVVLFVGSALAGVFSAIVVNAVAWLFGRLGSWLTKRAADNGGVILIANQPSAMGLVYTVEALEQIAKRYPEKFYVDGDKLLLRKLPPNKACTGLAGTVARDGDGSQAANQ